MSEEEEGLFARSRDARRTGFLGGVLVVCGEGEVVVNTFYVFFVYGLMLLLVVCIYVCKDVVAVVAGCMQSMLLLSI